MNTIKIYGASDDLIEVEGDVPGCDEYGSEAGVVELSTGDAFRIRYTDDGVWTVDLIHGDCRSIRIEKVPHGDGDDPEPYTDTVTITGEIEWVRFCPQWPMDAAAKRFVARDWLDRFELSDLPERIASDIYEFITTTKRKTS